MTGGIPDEWRLKAIRECDGAERLFGDSIARWLDVEHADGSIAAQTDRLRQTSRAALDGFGEFRTWLVRDATAATPSRYGCGPELFDLLLSRGHFSLRSRAIRMCSNLSRASLWRRETKSFHSVITGGG